MWEATGGGLSVTLSKQTAAFDLFLGPVKDPVLLPEWKEAGNMKDTKTENDTKIKNLTVAGVYKKLIVKAVDSLPSFLALKLLCHGILK